MLHHRGVLGVSVHVKWELRFHVCDTTIENELPDHAGSSSYPTRREGKFSIVG